MPKVHEDDPFRAIRAAKEIHDRIEALSPQFEGRIGSPPIPAYRVLSAKERPTLYLPGRMISSEMVGRNQELNLLKL